MRRPRRLSLTAALFLAAALSLAGVAVVACASSPARRAATGTGAPVPASTPALTTSSPAGHCSALQVLSRWPLPEVASQTIAVPVEESDVGAVAAAVRSGVGGVLLFGAEAPADLGSQLAALRSVTFHHLGLLVMTDEEGGGIQRMANLVGSMPWPRQMAERMTPSRIYALTREVARKMVANGVSVDLAPVLDVDGRNVYPGSSDPDGYRSFSGSTSVVTRDGLAYLEGMMAGGVLPVVKHFPGLGGVSGNTDDGPARTLPWPTLKKVALPPFAAAIAHGVPAVMTSNAVVPGLTTVPVSISQVATTTVLRREMGFRGLVITDSLSAGALSDIGYSVAKAAVAALRAGADVVLYGLSSSSAADVNEAVAIRKAIVAAVRIGGFPRSLVDAEAAEVLAAKHVKLCPG